MVTTTRTLPDVAEAVPEPLARNRDFKVVLVGQGVSSFGDAITNTALPLLVLALTGSGFAMGIVGALSTLPDLLIGLPAGAYADRWDRRRMMFVADLGRAVITAAVPLTFWLGGPTMAVILLITFPLNALRVLWLAAYTAAVPGLVGRPQIARANAIFESFFTVGWIAGPALAGIFSAAIGPASTIAIDAITFVISSGALLLVHRPLRPAPRAAQPHLVTDIREGVRYVAGHATLRAVILFWATSQVVTAALATALTYYITRDRGFAADVLGIVLSAFGVGSLFGSLAAGRRPPEAVGRALLIGTVVTGVILFAFTIGAPIEVMVVGALVAGITQSVVLIGYITLRTALSPDAMLGRIGSTARTISVGLMPIGSFVGGALIDLTNGGVTLAAMGALLLIASGAFALVPNLRRARVPRPGKRYPV
jgi:predicted MFS family arabinose efflux permease